MAASSAAAGGRSLLDLALAAGQLEDEVDEQDEQQPSSSKSKSRPTHSAFQKAVLNRCTQRFIAISPHPAAAHHLFPSTRADFQYNKHPDANERTALGQSLALSARAVQVWFQNRRQRQRQAEGEEQASSSASEEQQYSGADLDAFLQASLNRARGLAQSRSIDNSPGPQPTPPPPQPPAQTQLKWHPQQFDARLPASAQPEPIRKHAAPLRVPPPMPAGTPPSMEALLANSHQKNVHSVLLHNAHQQAAQLSTEREALNQQNQQLSEQNSQLRAALYSVLRNQLDSSFPDVAGVAPLGPGAMPDSAAAAIFAPPPPALPPPPPAAAAATEAATGLPPAALPAGAAAASSSSISAQWTHRSEPEERKKVQWAPSMGRSKKTKEVEAKNLMEVWVYQQNLNAAQEAQAQAQQEQQQAQQHQQQPPQLLPPPSPPPSSQEQEQHAAGGSGHWPPGHPALATAEESEAPAVPPRWGRGKRAAAKAKAAKSPKRPKSRAESPDEPKPAEPERLASCFLGLGLYTTISTAPSSSSVPEDILDLVVDDGGRGLGVQKATCRGL